MDVDPLKLEPHYAEIGSADQVQIYESILVDPDGHVTTGLLSAVRYLKDNRLLPRGFDKQTAEPDIAVRGNAADDADFVGGKDHVRYSVPIANGGGPFTVTAELLYQPIRYRWANNLEALQRRRAAALHELLRFDGRRIRCEACQRRSVHRAVTTGAQERIG